MIAAGGRFASSATQLRCARARCDRNMLATAVRTHAHPDVTGARRISVFTSSLTPVGRIAASSLPNATIECLVGLRSGRVAAAFYSHGTHQASVVVMELSPDGA